MEHIQFKAATTAADKGTFTAVISTATIDRDGDIVEPAAMVNALQKWAAIGKLVPLAWNHTDEVIGHIDPASAQVKGNEVVADGWIDQSTERGQEAWRLVKSGTFSFSFGYLIPKGGATKLAGGRYRIKELDIFEISGVPIAPANNDTRVLSWKNAAAEVFPDWALEAAVAGDIKAVWTTAYINDLPDSAFLYIEPGGEKDADGKTTPRSLRHFPYKDATGAVDMPHLRNAASRIPQSNLPQNVKDRLAARCQQLLDSMKSVDATDKEPKTVRSVDPLEKKARGLVMELLAEGSTPPATVTKENAPRPDLDPVELKARSRDLIVQLLTD